MKNKLILEELKQKLTKTKGKKERMIAMALAGAIALTPGVASADDEDNSEASVGAKVFTYETMVKNAVSEAPKVLEVKSFKDVPTSHWAYNSILALQGAGAIEEALTGLFEPNRKITREEFVVMLMKTLDLKSSIPVGSYVGEKRNNQGFVEATPFLGEFWDLWSYAENHPYIAKAVQNNVINGTSKNYFNPDGLLTREQAATILNSALKAYYKGTIKKTPLSFNDNTSVSSWAKEGVEAMVGMGIFKGKEGNLFDPKGNLTNAEAATIVKKITEITKGYELPQPKVVGQYKSVEERLKAAGAKYGEWKHDISKAYTFRKLKVDNATFRLESIGTSYISVPLPLTGKEEWTEWMTYSAKGYETHWEKIEPFENMTFEEAMTEGLIKVEFRDIYSDFWEFDVTEYRIKSNGAFKPTWNYYNYEKREILNLDEVLRKDPSLKDDIGYMQPFERLQVKPLSKLEEEKELTKTMMLKLDL